jgi:hypothetical protein
MGKERRPMDEIRAMIDAVAWRTMDSAPKDGTRVLVYVPDDDDGEIYKVVRYSLDSWGPKPGWIARGWWGAEDIPIAWKPIDPPPAIDFES